MIPPPAAGSFHARARPEWQSTNEDHAMRVSLD